MQATVSEIHRYPLRPKGYAEPLFHCRESRREILEHLAGSSWLSRASEFKEAVPGAGRTAHVRGESVEVSSEEGTPLLVRGGRRRRIRRVLERWREVREWWSENGRDLVLYRMEVSGGASEHMLVLDLARDRLSGEWTLVGVVD